MAPQQKQQPMMMGQAAQVPMSPVLTLATVYSRNCSGTDIAALIL